ncbi:putative lysosomal cobalamin transporter [Venturia nashicola]|nr:putative lysosomal cobalamin transporter [Venturia nashicola]
MPSSRRRKLSKPNSYLGQVSQSFPFLKLPAELRNRIYHLALVPDDPIQLTETVKKNRRHVATRTQRSVLQQRISHNILRTCKQVYYEAAPVLYGQPIEFSDPYGHGQTALVCFLSQIGKHGARMLQTIILDSVKVGKVSAFAHPVFTLLIDAVNLKELRINRLYEGNHKSDFPDADVGKLVQLFFPVAHVWLEQMGRSRVDGKDWKDVLSLAQCGQWLNPHWHPLPPFSRAKFYADIDLLCTM